MAYIESSIDWRAYQEDVIEEIGGSVYKGYPLVLRDSPIAGGILYEGRCSPGIVVDPNAQSDSYDVLYDRVKELASASGLVRAHAIMVHLGRVVQRHMRYSVAEVDQIIAADTVDIGHEDMTLAPPINLARYIRAGIGVCRHQALTMGYLAERFSADGYLPFSKISYDSNVAQRVGEDQLRGHAWLRLTCEEGDVVIFDAVDKVYESLSMTLFPPLRDHYWPYARPEDTIVAK